MIKDKKSGFTLIELLAVIIILAVILVIAIPKMMNVINSSRKSTFANSVKLIASSAEQKYTENKALNKDTRITCDSVVKLSEKEYKLCEISFEKNIARVTVIGSGKFDGLSIVYATKSYAEVQEGEPEKLYTYDDLYNIIESLNDKIDSLESITENYKKTIDELEKQINDNYKKIDLFDKGVKITEIDNLQSQINENNNKINSNTNTLINLTNIDNESNLLLKNYPIGSIYISENNINPSELFGGTWISYGTGRTLVGIDSSQTEFNTVGKTGGEKKHTLTIAEIPSHNHKPTTATPGTSTYNNYVFQIIRDLSSSSTARHDVASGSNFVVNGAKRSAADFGSISDVYYSSTTASTGGSNSHNNLQPYITVYMWKRVS